MTHTTWKRITSYFTGQNKRRIDRQPSGWKWHWKGRQADTNRLNLDQTDCVMRHVVLTRFIPVEDIVAIFDERDDIDQERAARLQRRQLKQLLTFNFDIAVRCNPFLRVILIFFSSLCYQAILSCNTLSYCNHEIQLNQSFMLTEMYFTYTKKDWRATTTNKTFLSRTRCSI